MQSLDTINLSPCSASSSGEDLSKKLFVVSKKLFVCKPFYRTGALKIFRLRVISILICYHVLMVNIASGLDVSLQYECLSDAHITISSESPVQLEKSTDPPSGKWKYPVLNSPYPLYAFLKLGDMENLLILDQENKDDVFYNRIYFDSNANHDLTDDPIISEDPSYKSDEYKQAYFINNIKVLMNGKSVQYALKLYTSYRGRKGRKPSKAAIDRSLKLLLVADCWYKGEFDFNGNHYNVYVGDGNANGKFNDRPSETDLSNLALGKPTLLHCDRFCLTRAPITSENMDLHEFHAVGDLLVVEGQTFQAKVDILHNKVVFTPVSSGLTNVKIPMNTERIGLYGIDNPHYIMMYWTEQEAAIPIGIYRLHEYRAYRNDDQGDGWIVKALATQDSPNITLEKDKETILNFGEPYMPIALVADWSRDSIKEGTGNTAAFQFVIKGAGKEQITDILHYSGNNTSIALSSENSARPLEPTLKILDEKGEEVFQIRFKYG